MTLITKPEKLVAPVALIGGLYGQPGSTKTTTALSAPRPVLLDFDNGLHRVKSQWRVDSLQVSSFQQVLDLLDGDELSPYETIVIDTVGKLIDSIIVWAIKKNPKDGNGRGSPSQQGWQTVKTEFATLVKRLKASGKSVLFVAHEAEKKNGEETIKRPDIAGASGKDIMKELDFMGYMELVGDKPVINFNPTERFYAKNSLDLDARVEVPNLADDKPNDFLTRYIFNASAKKLAADAALRQQYEEVITAIMPQVAALKTLDDVNKFHATVLPEMPVIWDSVYQAKDALRKRVADLNIEFDRVAKVFVAKAKKGASAGGKDQVASASASAPAGVSAEDQFGA